MPKQIPLHNRSNRFAIVDDEDYERFSQLTWTYTDGYAQCRQNGKNVWMSHAVLPPPNGYRIDHINRNKLDNRRENLRIATHSQNMANRPGSSKKKYKGTYFDSRSKKNPWIAQICFQNKSIKLGCFPTEIEAARAYDAKAKELFGEFAYTNFEVGVF